MPFQSIKMCMCEMITESITNVSHENIQIGIRMVMPISYTKYVYTFVFFFFGWSIEYEGEYRYQNRW